MKKIAKNLINKEEKLVKQHTGSNESSGSHINLQNTINEKGGRSTSLFNKRKSAFINGRISAFEPNLKIEPDIKEVKSDYKSINLHCSAYPLSFKPLVLLLVATLKQIKHVNVTK